MRKQITRPKQAASKSTLDKWQRAVKAIMWQTGTCQCGSFSRVNALAKQLLASMERAELK